MASLCFPAILAGCGQGRIEAGEKGAGVHVTLNGDSAPMGSIIVQNVLDPSQVQLSDCSRKPELLNGQAFCDEMLVLPAGVYEIVRAAAPNSVPLSGHLDVDGEPARSGDRPGKISTGARRTR